MTELERSNPIETQNPTPETEKLKISQLVDRAIEKLPPGTIGRLAVRIPLAAGVIVTAATRNPSHIQTVVAGQVGGGTGNLMNHLVGHLQGAHNSIQIRNSSINTAARFTTSALGGY